MLLESVHQMMIYKFSGVQQETLPHFCKVTQISQIAQKYLVSSFKFQGEWFKFDINGELGRW